MDTLSTTFAALADPTRRAILHRLARGEATVNELAKPFDLRLPTVSKHLQVLRQAGLVTQSRRAQWRPCRLEAKPLAAADRWLRFYERFWNEQLDALDEAPPSRAKPSLRPPSLHPSKSIRPSKSLPPSKRKR
jgi:DNA-binding transcriptional ArsR family regulator